MSKEKTALKAYFEANRVFLGVREEINASLINTFLGVCIWGFDRDDKDPLTIRELSSKIGLPYTTVSRHLRYLGDYERMNVEGMGLVKTDIYIMNRRQKTISLTTKGKAFRDRLLFSLGVSEED
jgi:DNA-binding transcriptional ArsR family regulator